MVIPSDFARLKLRSKLRHNELRTNAARSFSRASSSHLISVSSTSYDARTRLIGLDAAREELSRIIDEGVPLISN